VGFGVVCRALVSRGICQLLTCCALCGWVGVGVCAAPRCFAMQLLRQGLEDEPADIRLLTLFACWAAALLWQSFGFWDIDSRLQPLQPLPIGVSSRTLRAMSGGRPLVSVCTLHMPLGRILCPDCTHIW
jgi:hypothetical protein